MTGSLIGLLVGALLAGFGVALWFRRSGRDVPRSPSPAAANPPARAELISKIAHELKNPIMAIKGLAATGSRLYESIDDEERRELFRLIDAEAGRLRLIADQTSTTMKIDAGRLAYELREEDVGALVEETVWRTPVGDHPISVDTQSGLVAGVDRTRFAEVLANLLDNASKFSPAGSPIEVRALRDEGGGVAVEVADGGPGIPDERKDAVFERYGAWRPPGYEEVPGAGLGLFIARAHVRAHSGRLEVEDRPAGGTMLRVWLPAGG